MDAPGDATAPRPEKHPEPAKGGARGQLRKRPRDPNGGGPAAGDRGRASANRTKHEFCSTHGLNKNSCFVRLARQAGATTTRTREETGRTGRSSARPAPTADSAFLRQETGFQEGHGAAPSSLGIVLILLRLNVGRDLPRFSSRFA